MKQFRLVSAALLAMIVATPVFAADMPLKAPALVQVVSRWDGIYVGGSIGTKRVTDDWTTNCVQLGGPFTCGSALNAVVFPGAPDSTAVNSFKPSGRRYSVYVGAMFEVNHMWVVGAEADYGFYNRTDTVPGILGCSTFACTGGALVPFNLNGDFTSVANGDDYSLRLRAGFLVTPDILLYATGGVANQKVSAALTCNGNTSPACNFSLSETHELNTISGYTVGGGIEWKLLQSWLIRGEYRYSAFGSWDPVFFKNSGIIEVFPTIRLKSQIATVGLAYLLPVAQ